MIASQHFCFIHLIKDFMDTAAVDLDGLAVGGVSHSKIQG